MERATDISGRWRGHYEQDGGRHGISMEVAQRGGSFVGRMRDEDTVLSGTAKVPTIDEQGTENGSVDFETMGVLPEFSIVEGDVDGRSVAFVKRYEGTHSVVAWIDEGEEAQFEIPGHLVHYQGELVDDGSKLTGEWRIRCGDERGDGDAVGTFELIRQ
ncbi:MAG: hypothetical protein KAI24_08775 [Planctomycetes bacterium]|nr:hypothetical protein [Planctomycetota bacterium]